MTELPLYFERSDREGAQNTSFVARLRDGRLLLGPDGPVLTHFAAGKQRTLHMHMLGARAPVTPVPLDRQIGVVNDYTSPDRQRWRTGEAMFGKVQYPDVYPGADLVFRTSHRNFEYDIILHPGADPSRIALAFSETGQKPDVMLSGDGGLLVRNEGESTSFRQPVIYQTVGGRQQLVLGGYRLRSDGTVGFWLGSYDPSETLVIDPVLAFSTYFGADLENAGAQVALDPDGNLYLLGIGGPDTPSNAEPGSADQVLFVAKLDRTASRLLYITYVHPTDTYSNLITPSAIAVDWRGVATIGGTTSDPSYPLVRQLQDAEYCQPASEHSGFITTLDPSGAVSFSSYLCGRNYGDDRGDGTHLWALATNDDGLVAVAGFTEARDFPLTANAFQTEPGSGFLTEIDVDHARLVYSSYFATTVWIYALSIDRRGSVFIAGQTDLGSLESFPLKGPLFSGSCDNSGEANMSKEVGFLAKFDPDMKLVFSTRFGGAKCDGDGLRNTNITGLSIDAYGDPYVVGATNEPDLPLVNAYRAGFGGPGTFANTFIAKFNQTGSKLIYSTYLNPSSALAVSVDPQGLATVVGETETAEYLKVPFREKDPIPSDCVFCGFVLRLDNSGNDLLFSTHFSSGSVTSTTSNLLGDAVVSGSGTNVPLKNAAWPVPQTDGNTLFITEFESDPVTAAKNLLAYVLSGRPGILSDDLAIVEAQVKNRDWSAAERSLDQFDRDVTHLVEQHKLVTHIGDKLLAATRQFRDKIDTYPR